MSHGIYHMQPDATDLSQLSVVIMPSMSNRVGGIMPGTALAVDVNGVLSLLPATCSVIGGVKLACWQTYAPVITVGGVQVPAASITWNVAEWRSDGVTVNVVLDFTINLATKPVSFYISPPAAPLGPTGWPLNVAVTSVVENAYAYVDVTNGLCVSGTAGTAFPTGSSHFQVFGFYRVS